LQVQQQLQDASNAREMLQARVAGLQRNVSVAEKEKADAKANIARYCSTRHTVHMWAAVTTRPCQL